MDIKMGLKNAQEKRKLTLQEIGDDLNKIVNGESFAKSISDYDREFSSLLLDLLSKIIHEMGNGLGETKIGNVLYRFVCLFFSKLQIKENENIFEIFINKKIGL